MRSIAHHVAQIQPHAAWRWAHKHRRLTVALFVVGMALTLFTELADELGEGGLMAFDSAVQSVVRAHHTMGLDWIAHFLSAFILPPTVFVVVAPFLIYLLARRRYVSAAGLVVIPLLTLLAVGVLKLIFHRQRPLSALVTQLGNSFPSSHATASTVLYGLLGYVAWRYWGHSKWLRMVIAAAAMLMILSTGLARVYLEVHYPSDVLAGWAAGVCILLGSIILIESREKP